MKSRLFFFFGIYKSPSCVHQNKSLIYSNVHCLLFTGCCTVYCSPKIKIPLQLLLHQLRLKLYFLYQNFNFWFMTTKNITGYNNCNFADGGDKEVK